MRDPNRRPKLLVSVRDAGEAIIALAGGADIIDVKEPTRGPLGAADASAIGRVLAAVEGRAPVSIAAGELSMYPPIQWSAMTKALADRVAYVKWGLADCGDMTDWPDAWRKAALHTSRGARAVAVVYADWPAAAAPPPDQVLDHARVVGCAVLLVDTWDKSSGGLFDLWSPHAVKHFCQCVHDTGMAVALAGSLCESSLADAARSGADIVAVRGAACEGGRAGPISTARLRAVREILQEVDGTRLAADRAFR